MAYFSPPGSSTEKFFLFGKGGGKRMSEYLKIPLLGQIPIHQRICESGEDGEPIAWSDKGDIAKKFINIAQNIVKHNLVNAEN